MSEQVETKILMALFEENELGVRKLCRKEAISSKTLVVALRHLQERGLIQEKHEGSWRRGQAKSYALTPKGLEHLTLANVEDLNTVFRRIRQVAAEVAGDPSRIDLWRRWAHEQYGRTFEPALDRAMENGAKLKSTLGYFKPKEWERLMQAKENIYGPLDDCIWSFFEIHQKVYGPFEASGLPTRVVLGFTAEGSIYKIPVSEIPQDVLRKHGAGI